MAFLLHHFLEMGIKQSTLTHTLQILEQSLFPLPGQTVSRSNSPSLSVNVSTVEQSGDWVLVEWKYVDQPSIHDWIGLYTVQEDFKNKTIDPTEKAPVKFQV